MNFNILDFGAINDGKKLNTNAIQSAIDACSESGGGRVVIENGIYATGTIILKQNVELHIAASGRLLGSADYNDYPERTDVKHVDSAKLPRNRNACLIFAEECENISITGMGTIDCNGTNFVKLKDEYMIACESDIHAAMTMALLKSATLGKGKPLFGEFTVRHPEKKNAELLWHCGQFPLSQKADDCEACLVNQREWFRAKDGTYTVARIDQENGNYMLLPVMCNTTEGPKTSGTYIWAEFDDLKKVENRVMQGPYIHHFIEIEGNYMDELEEFCKYIQGLNSDVTIK